MHKKQKRYGDGTAFFQKEFSDGEFLRFARIFGCDGSERFRCAVLFSRIVPVGFLLTNKAVHFEDGRKIEFTNGSFQNENVKISSETFFNATLGVLKIEADGFFKEYYFKNTNLDALEALKAFLKGAFAGNTVENYDFSMTFKIIKGNKALDFFGAIIDKATSAINFILEKIDTFVEAFYKKIDNIKENKKKAKAKKKNKKQQKSNAKNEKTEWQEIFNETQESATKNSTETQNQQEQEPFEPIKVSRKNRPNTLVQVIDFFASMAFISGLIFALKPEILLETFGNVEIAGMSGGFGGVIQSAGNILFGFIGIQAVIGNIDLENLLFWRNLTVFSCIVLFFLLKLIVIFSQRTRTQVIAFLMVIITLLASFIIKDKFLLFLALIVVAYFAFELLIGMHPSTIFGKLFSLTIVGFVEYLVLNLTLNVISRNLLIELVNSLAIRGLSWW